MVSPCMCPVGCYENNTISLMPYALCYIPCLYATIPNLRSALLTILTYNLGQVHKSLAMNCLPISDNSFLRSRR